MAHVFRVGTTFVGLALIGLALTGCIGGPTYGTSQTSSEQLLDDLGSIATIGSPKRKNDVAYAPRPGLVVPKDKNSLVEPQASLAGKDNPNWVESPEEARKRLVAEADANANNPYYRSPLLVSPKTGKPMTEGEQLAAFRAAKAEAQGSAVSERRRFLTDPPAGYRTTDSANLTDLGTPETEKEKQRKKAAAKAGTGRQWWQVFN
jgi:hypothetical protein